MTPTKCPLGGNMFINEEPSCPISITETSMSSKGMCSLETLPPRIGA